MTKKIKDANPSTAIILGANGKPISTKSETIENSFAPFAPINPFGFPQQAAVPGTEQISRIDTLEKNMRWYLVSNFRQVLSQAYVEIGLIQTIIDVPVDDAFRGGMTIKSQDLDEDDLKKLHATMKRNRDLRVAKLGCKWERLFGGGGILILIGDQDPKDELDMDAINEDTEIEFRAVDLWELFWNLQNTDGFDPSLQEQEFEFYNYYGVEVHKSRVMKLKGHEAPSFIRPRLRGWGTSKVETLIRSINQYLKGTDLAFEVLDEFKLDIYMLDGLATALQSPTGEADVARRVFTANRQKNYQNAIVLDGKDKYESKEHTFSGLADTMAGIRMQVASDMRMPLTKIFGISAAGFNSGEDDIEVYNGMIESEIRDEAIYHIHRIIEIRCKKLFGYVPDDLEIDFKPLRILSAIDEEGVKTAKNTRLLAARQQGDITTKEYRERVNVGGLMDMPLSIDDEDIDPDDPEIDAVLSGEVDTQDVEDPGGARADTRKPAAGSTGGIAKGGPAKSKGENPTPAAPNKPPKKTVTNREPYRNPGNVDEALWAKAKRASQKALGKVKYAFVTWWYKEHGGTFK